jgi:hypothetical protein
MKFVEVQLYLFGKPEWEFGGKINPKILKKKGDELKERLYKISNDLKKLTDNGWDYEPTLYDITLTKNTSESAAKKELKKLKIKSEIIVLDDEEFA